MKDNKPLTVCGIIGHNFSGSTLLSWVVGSHPKIVPLGESHHLVEGLQYEIAKKKYGRPVGCYHHGATCPVYPHKELPYSPAEMHRIAASRQGAPPILIDESKLVNSFRVYERNKSADYYKYIILFKPPEGYIHSFQKRKGPGLDYTVAQLTAWYCAMAREAYSFTKDKPRLWLPYEAFSADPSGTLEKIARLLEVDPALFDLEHYQEAEFHPTGGNTKVIVNKAPVELRQPWIEDPPVLDDLSRQAMDRAYSAMMDLA